MYIHKVGIVNKNLNHIYCVFISIEISEMVGLKFKVIMTLQ